MEISKLEEILINEPAYRRTQARQALFAQMVENWNSVTGLPKELRHRLDLECPLNIEAGLAVSSDASTMKALIILDDGKAIETVLMRHAGGRNTLCVSCMVGCPMNCAFCATGAMGLLRKLTTEEILIQAVYFGRLLKKEGQRIGSVVFMGMGEPMHNYDNVMAAIRHLQDPEEFNIGARHISISTCGILEGIIKLAKEELPVNLAISLHGSNDGIRSRLMPIGRTYDIKKLMETVDEYIALTNRKVMFEYIMIKGVNDSDKNALELAGLLKNKLAFVNLIQYNPTRGDFMESSSKRIKDFRELLENNGVTVTMRYKFGQDIDGACGQLATKKK